jgi:ASC-1-like (ASCH) protein
MKAAKRLPEPWFSLVATGKKVYEASLANGALADLPAGALVTFYNADLPGPRREAEVRVTGKKKFKTFRAMLGSSRNALEKTLPTVKTVDAGVDVYRKSFSASDEKAHGVLRLTLSLA